ncbi:MAG TPA: S1 RNA-binding domain-containing protein [Thermoanaerobaculia bacterium]
MSEREHPSVSDATETTTESAAAPEAQSPEVAAALAAVAEAAATVESAHGETASRPAVELGVEVAVEDDAAALAAAPADAAAQPPTKKRERATKRKRPVRRPRSEEFVAPTPEELAGLTSDGVRQALDKELPVVGKVIGWNAGGFHVVVDGISAFCPRSSMELGAPHEPAKYLDQEHLFRVLRVEEKGHRLVLSRAAVLLEEKRHLVDEARKRVQVGAVLRGKVISVLDFGAFVDLGGVEGMIHVSELAHHRVAHPSELLTVGQEVEAKVVKLPAKKNERASLSLRALAADPWESAAEHWPAGGKFSGTVKRKSDFGWFVELAPGIEGLLHPSNLAPGMKPEDPQLADGAALAGWVREVDPGRRRISLALREVPAGDPWRGVEKRYAEGAIVEGTVERVAPFGAFVELEPGLTGLLPTSEMGLPRGASLGKAYPVGKQIKLKVSEVDPRRKRISLTREEKALEGSKSDYHSYLKRSRKAEGMGALAAAFERLKG